LDPDGSGVSCRQPRRSGVWLETIAAPCAGKITSVIVKVLACHRSFGYLAALLSMAMAATLLASCVYSRPGGIPSRPHRSALASMSVSTGQPTIPTALIDPDLDLRAGPVDVPLELRIPSLEINAPVLGVGLTAQNVMDAPKGLATDPVWQKVFWYRGSSIPGDVGTATLAGHVDDARGRPAIFARLSRLQPGDLIVVHDTRRGVGVSFTVVETASYSAQEAADPAILARVYGSGPVSGLGPQPAADGLAHLTLITCSGGFVNGSYDRRLVVYATRSESK
jgi:sortase (surface protein transpeptidase)